MQQSSGILKANAFDCTTFCLSTFPTVVSIITGVAVGILFAPAYGVWACALILLTRKVLVLVSNPNKTQYESLHYQLSEFGARTRIGGSSDTPSHLLNGEQKGNSDPFAKSPGQIALEREFEDALKANSAEKAELIKQNKSLQSQIQTLQSEKAKVASSHAQGSAPSKETSEKANTETSRRAEIEGQLAKAQAELSQTQKRLAELTTTAESSAAKLKEAHAHVTKLDAEAAQAKVKHAEALKAVTDQVGKLQAAAAEEKTKQDGALKTATDRVSRLEAAATEARALYDRALKAAADEAAAVKKQNEDTITELTNDNVELKAQVATITEAFTTDTDSAVKKLSVQLKETQASITTIRDDAAAKLHQAVDAERKQLSQQHQVAVAALNDQLEKAKTAAETQRAQIQTNAAAQVKVAQDQLDAVRKQNEQLGKDVQARDTEAAEQAKKVAALAKQLQILGREKADLELLKNDAHVGSQKLQEEVSDLRKQLADKIAEGTPTAELLMKQGSELGKLQAATKKADETVLGMVKQIQDLTAQLKTADENRTAAVTAAVAEAVRASNVDHDAAMKKLQEQNEGLNRQVLDMTQQLAAGSSASRASTPTTTVRPVVVTPDSSKSSGEGTPIINGATKKTSKEEGAKRARTPVDVLNGTGTKTDQQRKNAVEELFREIIAPHLTKLRRDAHFDSPFSDEVRGILDEWSDIVDDKTLKETRTADANRFVKIRKASGKYIDKLKIAVDKEIASKLGPQGVLSRVAAQIKAGSTGSRRASLDKEKGSSSPESDIDSRTSGAATAALSSSNKAKAAKNKNSTGGARGGSGSPSATSATNGASDVPASPLLPSASVSSSSPDAAAKAKSSAASDTQSRTSGAATTAINGSASKSSAEGSSSTTSPAPTLVTSPSTGGADAKTKAAVAASPSKRRAEKKREKAAANAKRTNAFINNKAAEIFGVSVAEMSTVPKQIADAIKQFKLKMANELKGKQFDTLTKKQQSALDAIFKDFASKKDTALAKLSKLDKDKMDELAKRAQEYATQKSAVVREKRKSMTELKALYDNAASGSTSTAVVKSATELEVDDTSNDDAASVADSTADSAADSEVASIASADTN